MIKPLILRPDVNILKTHPELLKQATGLSQTYAEKGVYVTDEMLKTLGSTLWRTLDSDSALQKAKTQAGQHILPIVIVSDDPQILQLPWEILYNDTYGFLGRHEGFTLSRTIPSATGALPEVENGPLRIMLFTSLPDSLDETDQLHIEEEQARVLEVLGQWRQSGYILLEMPDDGRFSEFKRLLKTFSPHLVYLSGHGGFHKDFLNQNDKGYFLFEGEDGNGEPIDEDQLADAFTGTAVQAVILSACQSAKASSASLNNGLAYRLAQQCIPYIVGMRESILDRTGIQFAHAFFTGLMVNKLVAVALQHARQAIVSPLIGQEDVQNTMLAAISLGQWCLPMLLCHEQDRPIVTGNFTPQSMQPANLFNDSLDTISLPVRFIGRRRELRKIQRVLRGGKTSVLLTGEGGIGKTSLAGKLVNGLKDIGYEVFAFSARPEHDWHESIFQMELSLDEYRTKAYTKIQQNYTDKTKIADALLKLLLDQHKNKVVLFFDNLELVLDKTTNALNDLELKIWIDAAIKLKPLGITVVLTSRWTLPRWKEQIIHLGKPVYRDFLAVAQQQKLPKTFLQDYARLRRAYTVLGGNYQALEFFAAALQDMGTGEEREFLDSLQEAQEKIQVNMLLDEVYDHRSNAEQELLLCLLAFDVPVAIEGVKTVAPNHISHSEEVLDALLSVSLFQRYENTKWQTNEFLVSPIVRNWLNKKGVIPSQELLGRAAYYFYWLLKNERRTLDQAKITHTAFCKSGMDEEAYCITLDWIVEPMSMAGLYQILIEKWLLPACKCSNPVTLAKALGATGVQYINLADYDTALKYLERSLMICREIGDKYGEGATLGNIGTLNLGLGDYDTAIEYLKKSLSISQEIGDKAGEWSSLNNISQIYMGRGDYDFSLEYLKRSLTISQEIGDKFGEGRILNNISRIFKVRGDYASSLEYLKRSLAISQAISDKCDEGTTLNNISGIYNARGDYGTALEYLKRSLTIQQEIGDKAGEGTTLTNISRILKVKGEYDNALEYLKRSLTIMQEIRNKAGEGVTLNNISQIFHDRGEYDTALEYLKRSLTISKEIGDKKGEGTTLNNISQIYHAHGDYDTALEYLKRSLTISKKIGDKRGEGTTYNNIAALNRARGDYETSLKYLIQSLKISEEIRDKIGEGITLNNISQIYKVQGDFDTAFAYLKCALSIAEEIGDLAGEGTTLNNIRGIYHAQGDFDTALAYLNRTLVIFDKIGDTAGLCATLFNMGHIYLQNDDKENAASSWIVVYRIASEMNLAQVLQALEGLAPQIGLEGGLEGWEKLARKMGV